MSSIDVVDHVHCGNLQLKELSVPIYWVLNDYTTDVGQEASNNDLLIGGGSGEHPTLLIKNADLLPLYLLMDKELLSEEDESNALNIIKNRNLVQDDVNFMYFETRLFLDFNDWPLKSLAKIQYTFDEGKDNLASYDCEKYFLFAIATFALSNMPDVFFDENVLKLIEKNKKFLKIEFLESIFSITAPSIDTKVGRIIKDKKLIWGYSLDDYNFDLFQKKNKPKL